MNLIGNIPVAITRAEPQGHTFALLPALPFIVPVKTIDQGFDGHGSQGV